MSKFLRKFDILVDCRKFGHLLTKTTLTLARIEIIDFWDKILKAMNLGIQNLVSEHIYLNTNSRYGSGHDFCSYATFRKAGLSLFRRLPNIIEREPKEPLERDQLYSAL